MIPENIVNLSTIDQLLEDLCQMLEEKNAANLLDVLASCTMGRQGMVKQIQRCQS
jgi:hypothetical protein